VPRARYRAHVDGSLKRLEPISDQIQIWDHTHRRSFVIEEAKALRFADHRFVFHPDDAHLAVDGCCQWAGDQVLFNGDRPAFINPDTLKMHYPAAPSLHGGTAHVSPDARWMIYSNADGAWLSEVQGLTPPRLE
jgi:hypothetical protein